MMGMPTRMWRLLGLLDVAVLQDAVAEAGAAAVAGEAVLRPGAAEPGGGDGQHLLADDVVLAPAFVREVQINAQLSGAAVGGLDVHLDLLEAHDLLPVPEAAQVQLRGFFASPHPHAHGVEPEVRAELAAEVVPAGELGPVALAAPAVVAVAEAVQPVGLPGDGHGAGHGA